MKFDYKLYKIESEKLLAISDSSIIGKSFQEKEIEIIVSKDFYSEKKCDEKEALLLIKNSTIVNAIGKEIVKLMIKEKFVDENNVLYIEGVPHAQIAVMK